MDVSLISPASGPYAPATLRLRIDGLLDAYQGAFLSTVNSAVNQAPSGPASWTAAYGLATVTTTDWFVCGDKLHILNAIWMFPSQVGVVVGGNGVIMRTTTGGQ